MNEENNSSKVTLRDYVDTKFEAINKAVDLAGENLKTRLDSLNEWRLQNKDERESYVTRKEFDILAKTVYIGIGIILSLQFLFKYIFK